MQSQILAQNPSSELQVYAIWLPMLWSDARETWSGITMPDNRVKHFWDSNTLIGEWFAEEVEGYRGIAWDVYYLFGPDATWDQIPSPMIGSGGTIYDERETLKRQVSALLAR